MTTNIKANGYSSSNPESNLFTIQASYALLMTLMMNNVMSTVLDNGNPEKMVLNGSTSTIYIDSDSSFLFADSIPLANDITFFTMQITYRYTNSLTSLLTDTVVTITFYVQKSAQTSLPPGTDLTSCQAVRTVRHFTRSTNVSITSRSPVHLFTLNGRELKGTTSSDAFRCLKKGIYFVKEQNGNVRKLFVADQIK